MQTPALPLEAGRRGFPEPLPIKPVAALDHDPCAVPETPPQKVGLRPYLAAIMKLLQQRA